MTGRRALPYAALALAVLCARDALAAPLREGVRILGDVRFADVNGDATPDWLAGRAECFSKQEGQAEITTPCVALIDGRRWAPLWRRHVPRFGTYPPVIAGRWVVLDVGEPLFTAYDAGGREVFWEFRTDGVYTAPMVAVGGWVLVVVGGDHVYLIDPAGRRPLWDQRLWSPVRLPLAVANGRVLAATARELVAMDLSSGRIAWRFPAIVSALSADEETLFVAFREDERSRHGVAALVLASGVRRWRRDRHLRLDASPLLGLDHVYLFGEGRVVALDRADGTTAWSAPARGRLVPVGADEDVVVLLREAPGAPQEVRALDRETGKTRWSRAVEGFYFEAGGRVVGRVVVLWARERAAAGGPQGRVEGISTASGRTLWAYDSDQKITAILSVDETVVRVQQERGFAVLDTRSGAELRRHAPVALARIGKSLAERLRYLVYVVPALVIVAGLGAWLRRWMRRSR